MSTQGKLIDHDTVQFERVLPAPIEVVWEYLTIPDRVASWLAIAHIEPHKGGTANLEWEGWSTEEPPPSGATHWVATGIVTHWDPPRKLAYTWNQPGEPESEITFDLTPKGDETLLILTHRRLGKSRHMYAAGWHAHLDLLAARLKGGDRGDFIAQFKALLPKYPPAIIERKGIRAST
jgi:uncharacterized protein YndB with AHSA1/START domain